MSVALDAMYATAGQEARERLRAVHGWGKTNCFVSVVQTQDLGKSPGERFSYAKDSSVALDRIAYFGEQLSDNVVRTPEGHIICRNSVIARTGFQTYRASEIDDPEGLLGDEFGPDDEIDVFRPIDQVLDPATLASFEGKPLTLTHPYRLLDLESTRDHAQGHVQNIHKAAEPLQDGNWPVLADVYIDGPEAVRAWETGARELSCGYTYKLAKTGDRYDQTNILGNHVALVSKGRAGGEARLNDAAADEKQPEPLSLDAMYARAGKEASRKYRCGARAA